MLNSNNIIKDEEIVDIVEKILSDYYQENTFQTEIVEGEIILHIDEQKYTLQNFFEMVPELKILLKKEINTLIELKNKKKLYEFYQQKNNTLQEVKLKYQNNNFDIMEDDDGIEYVMKSSTKNIWRETNRHLVWVYNFRMFKDKISLQCTRSSNKFVEAVVMKYVFAIQSKQVMIRNIFRIPGIRTKIIVCSNDEHITNPKQSCTGNMGSEIYALHGVLHEKIDFVNYDDNFDIFLQELFGLVPIIEHHINDSELCVQISKKYAIQLNYDHIKLIKNCIRYFFPQYYMTIEWAR